MVTRAGDGCEFVDDGIAGTPPAGLMFKAASMGLVHRADVPFADQVSHVMNHFQGDFGVPACVGGE